MRNMHPLLRSLARRAALSASRRRGDCGSGKKGALSSIHPEVRAQMRATEEVVQVRPRRGLDFTAGWTSVMIGVLIVHIGFKFKQPPKTLEQLWLEAHARKQVSEADT